MSGRRDRPGHIRAESTSGGLRRSWSICSGAARNQRGEEAMVGHPVAAEHGEADEEGADLGQRLPDRVAEGLPVLQDRHPDLDDEERERDGEDRVGEERNPLELEAFAGSPEPHRGASAVRPANRASAPSSASMRSSRFHLAVRSERVVEPTLI